MLKTSILTQTLMVLNFRFYQESLPKFALNKNNKPMKIIIITIASLLTLRAYAQKIKETEVPANVKSAFEKKYPNVKVEKWEKEGADFEAEFDLNKVESSALFDANGSFKEIEQEINTTELPKPATEYCTKTFADYKIVESSKITDASGTITYEAEVKKGKEELDVIFDQKGNFIKKS